MTPEVEAKARRHDLRVPDFVHTNLEPAQCACRLLGRPASSSGNSCHVCGGITVQTGTCTTCTNCGESGGCG